MGTMHTMYNATRLMRLAPLALLACGAVSCGLDKQTAPPLAGPSEFGQSITMTVTPDTLMQDGSSQATVRAIVRDGVTGQPVRGLQILFTGDSTRPSIVPAPTFTAASVATDSNGVAETQLIAPAQPATAPPSDPYADPVVTVSATPVGSNYANEVPRSVRIRIIPPPETPRPDGPQAVIVTGRNPVMLGESVTFDGSFSTYGGMPCGTHCDYIWSITGPVVDDEVYSEGPFRAVKFERTFETAGTYTVALLVTDENGRAHSTSATVAVLAYDSKTATVTR
jgi:hypothetical protein